MKTLEAKIAALDAKLDQILDLLQPADLSLSIGLPELPNIILP